MRWTTLDYTGWGRALTATGDIARPERKAALEALSTQAPAIGGRRSYGDAGLNDGGKAVDMTRLNRVLDFEAETGIVTVEGGLAVGDLAQLYAPKGWLPAVMPGTGFATIGGCIAMDVHGKNHHAVGSFGQHVVAITLVQNGKTRRITPKDAGLWQATIGGLGQTGIIASAELQLLRCKGDVMMVTERRAEGWDEFLSLLDSSEASYSVGWIDATATGDDFGRGILEEAETGAGLIPAPKKSKTIPFNAPHFALSKPIVRMFNKAYYNRVPSSGRTSVKPISEFFFPLDKIHDWNKLYGKRGFHQFQCVVPIAQADALRAMLELIADSGLASPLAVLKRMGEGRAGYLSFPMEGYTLAVDFPNRPTARHLVGRLEEMTEDAGGRLYLAKDALATAKRVHPMYPELAAWRKVVAKADPDAKLTTDLIRRLNLRDGAMTDIWIILGATSSIARVFARHVASQGAAVILAGRDAADLAATRADCLAHGAEWAKAHVFDVRDPATFDAILTRAGDDAGMINAAVFVGSMPDQSEIDADPSMIAGVVTDSFTGPANFLTRLAPLMEERGGGAIVGVGSVAGDRGRLGNYVYGAAKAGFATYLSGLRNRMGRKGVHVMTVKPGPVDTAMTWGLGPQPFMTTPDKVVADIMAGLRKKQNVIYTAKIWRLVMFVIRSVPEPIFKKLSI